MKGGVDVVVVGAGIAGLTAAIYLGTAGLRVRVLEAGARVGGKAGIRVIDGVEVDTGPSLLTLPDVFEDVFRAAGQQFERAIELVRPEPAFVYGFADGIQLQLASDLDASTAAVERCFSSEAAAEFRTYLEHAGRIWQAAAPEFVYAEAPRFGRLLRRGPRRLARLWQIDAHRSMERGIARLVRHPHLRDIFRRFATYNGSDVRRAPGTLACIAHVELALGAWGVRGGLHALARALESAASSAGVEFQFERPVREVALSSGAVKGVVCEDGEVIDARHVVLNADVGATRAGLLGRDLERTYRRAHSEALSMSAYTGVVRTRRRQDRRAHTVLFPADYAQEFIDIFDRSRAPEAPAVYVCALEPAHGRSGWEEDESLFVMVNAPALSAGHRGEDSDRLQDQLLRILSERGHVSPSDRFVWWRTPADLAREFPGSRGALYGAAFHGPWAAFRRLGAGEGRIHGLHFASGSAHPGGGVPLAALSGKQAAGAIMQSWRRSA